MNESMERALADWLHEGPDSGPLDGLERALAATRHLGQRPGWTLPERWIPMQLTMARTRSQRPLVAIAMLALLILTVFATTLFIGSRREAPPPFRNGAVVYSQDGDLFIADQLDGTARPLVAGPDPDSDPVFSPKGDRVAFVRGGRTIMAVGPDGADLTELATVPRGGVTRLGWSPDGRTLLASSFATGALWYQTYVIASDGSGSHTLGVGSNVITAAWRPDGSQILFRGILDGDDATRGVYVADADGTNVRKLAVSPFYFFAGGLEWSPDGNHIAFKSSAGLHGAGISIADIDAGGAVTDVRELRIDPEWTPERDPRWSPDGSELAILLSKDSALGLGIVNLDGSGYRLVGPQVYDRSVDFTWAPDGRSLVVVEQPVVDDVGNIGAWGTVWSVDVVTGEQTEVQTPVQSWQRLTP